MKLSWISCRPAIASSRHCPAPPLFCAPSARPMGSRERDLDSAIASPNIADRLHALLGSWAVSGPAIEIGCAALADGEWLGRSIAELLERVAVGSAPSAP